MKISVIQDLHIDFKKQKIMNNIPLSFYVTYKQIFEILKGNPDVLIIQGDLINNVVKLDLITINLIVLLFYKIFKDIKKIPIYIIQGNHDIMFNSMNEIDEIGSFVSIFKNTRNVLPCVKYRRIQLLPNFNLHLVPYTTRVKEIYNSINNLNKHFNLFIFHQDFDFIEKEIGINSSTPKNRTIRYNDLKYYLNGSNYYILNGHYHRHKDYKDRNFSIISSLSQNTFSEQISSIDDINKYHGYMNVYFNTKDDVKFEFIPSKYRIVSLKYISVDDFKNEFKKLKQYIMDNNGFKFFKIRIIDTNERKKEIKEYLKELKIIENVVECNFISKMIDLKTIEIENDKDNTQQQNKINLIEYYKEQLVKLIKGTEYEKYTDKMVQYFIKIIEMSEQM